MSEQKSSRLEQQFEQLLLRLIDSGAVTDQVARNLPMPTDTGEIVPRLWEAGIDDVKLAKALAGKAAQARYEAFLDRVPAFIAGQARGRSGTRLKVALEAYAAAQDLAGAARGLSLDAQGTVFEMAGIIATLR